MASFASFAPRAVLPAAMGFATAAAMSLAAPAPALAEQPRLSVEWERLADVLQNGTQALARFQAPSLTRPESAAGEDEHLVDMTPHLTLLARDWSGAQVFAGHLALTDQVRLIRSSRMVLTRVHVGSGRLTPFVQAGLGQWRIDGDLMPGLPREAEPAAQLGGGFELRLAPRAVLALELDTTYLCSLDGRPALVPDTRPWTGLLVGRAGF